MGKILAAKILTRGATSHSDLFIGRVGWGIDERKKIIVKDSFDITKILDSPDEDFRAHCQKTPSGGSRLQWKKREIISAPKTPVQQDGADTELKIFEE
jgi:hypothetical protein